MIRSLSATCERFANDWVFSNQPRKKFEARNPKQIQMNEKHKIQNILDSDSAFWIFRV